MSFCGISRYEPHWLSGRGVITAAHTSRLESLSGRQLTDSWLVWDHRYRRWLRDCPVVLNFDGEQVEICHQKFDDLSITWNTIVPTAPIEWSDVDDKNSGPCRLEWRTDADPRLAALNGCQLKDIALLEWRDHIPDFGNGSLAITFDFGLEQVTIANGLDENALRFGQPDFPVPRRPTEQLTPAGHGVHRRWRLAGWLARYSQCCSKRPSRREAMTIGCVRRRVSPGSFTRHAAWHLPD